jgi:hypothetical protein
MSTSKYLSAIYSSLYWIVLQIQNSYMKLRIRYCTLKFNLCHLCIVPRRITNIGENLRASLPSMRTRACGPPPPGACHPHGVYVTTASWLLLWICQLTATHHIRQSSVDTGQQNPLKPDSRVASEKNPPPLEARMWIPVLIQPMAGRNLSQMNPLHILISYLRPVLLIFYYLCLGFRSSIYPSGSQNTICVLFPCVNAACLAQLVFRKRGEVEKKLRNIHTP